MVDVRFVPRAEVAVIRLVELIVQPDVADQLLTGDEARRIATNALLAGATTPNEIRANSDVRYWLMPPARREAFAFP